LPDFFEKQGWPSRDLGGAYSLSFLKERFRLSRSTPTASFRRERSSTYHVNYGKKPGLCDYEEPGSLDRFQKRIENRALFE
jgi:hypothetical protein